MRRHDRFPPNGWETRALISREVRLDADGTPWTDQRDPVLRGKICEVYRKLCESGEFGKQLVAVHQEINATLVALIKDTPEASGSKQAS